MDFRSSDSANVAFKQFPRKLSKWDDKRGVEINVYDWNIVSEFEL